jgi:Tfp pilus assembly protein PilO
MNMSTGLGKTSPNQNLVAVGIVLILASLGVCYGFLVPGLLAARTNEAKSHASLVAVQTQIDSLNAAGALVNASNSQLASEGLSFGYLQQVLPVTEDLPGLYIQMESVVAQSSATVGGITYQFGTPIADPLTGAKIPITVSGNGDYPDLKTFIGRFENNVRPVTFDQLSFTVATATAPGSSGSTPAPATTTAPTAKGPVTVTATGYVTALGLSSAFATTTSPTP